MWARYFKTKVILCLEFHKIPTKILLRLKAYNILKLELFS